jgi:hypothetical protein
MGGKVIPTSAKDAGPTLEPEIDCAEGIDHCVAFALQWFIFDEGQRLQVFVRRVEHA